MGEDREAANDWWSDYPTMDDRKILLDLWQEHAPVPDIPLRDGTFDALLAVASWGYNRAIESVKTSMR